MDKTIQADATPGHVLTKGCETMIETDSNQGCLSSRQTAQKKRAGKWVQSLLTSDVNCIWTELYRIVSSHPLARSARQAGLFSSDSSMNYFSDLTQELFVRLHSKGRFEHYIETEMSDAEIECEISQLELKNLLTTELRKRFPESYRIARRIATILHGSPAFRRFDSSRSKGRKPRRVAEQIYGLSIWSDDKLREETTDIEQLIKLVPVRQRDTRMVGRTGDAQILISNIDLEDLIISILKTIDQPVSIRTLRSLVMSRLPVLDVNLVSLTEENSNEERTLHFKLVDERENAEELLLRREAEREAMLQAVCFIRRIRIMTKNKPKQTKRALGVLWYCYLLRPHKTQFEAAMLLGVSGSLVSNYCCRIETELRALKFANIEIARLFEHALRERLRHDWAVQPIETIENQLQEVFPLEFPRIEMEWVAA
jgi:hypothetical protein